jgi:predicted transcriptional regulator
MLNEKTNQAERYETELKDARAMLGKLEEQRDTLEKELIDTKTSRDLQYKELTRIQDEFSQYKKDNEDKFAFGSSVRKLLETSIEGKIILELRNKSPQTIDNLAEKLSETAVKAKQSINTLRDLGIVKVDEETRSVSI